MTRDKSRELRHKNNCDTCERRGNFEIGCQVFKEEPEKCWAWTDDKGWLAKVDKECKAYRESGPIKD
jgi:hypothetical protein